MKKKGRNENNKVWKRIEVSIPLKEGLEASYTEGILSIKGSKGEVSHRLRYPGVSFLIENNNILIYCERPSKVEKNIIYTYKAHIFNMIEGVTAGFEYVLRVVYAKFPISIEFNEGKFTVKNFLGEKVSRSIYVPSEVNIKINGKEVIVTSLDKEKAGQVAANIEQLTKITHMDRRVIQDGIFIIKKPHKSYV